MKTKILGVVAIFALLSVALMGCVDEVHDNEDDNGDFPSGPIENVNINVILNEEISGLQVSVRSNSMTIVQSISHGNLFPTNSYWFNGTLNSSTGALEDIAVCTLGDGATISESGVLGTLTLFTMSAEPEIILYDVIVGDKHGHSLDAEIDGTTIIVG